MDRNERTARRIREDLACGEAWRAYDEICRLKKAQAEDLVLSELEARTLVALGDRKQARQKLEGLLRKGHETSEVVGILASLEKDEALRLKEPAAREAALRRALRRYAEMCERWNEYWAGINVATLAFVLGEQERATDAARRVIEYLESRPRAGVDLEEDTWTPGTLGEAHLVCHEVEKAREGYAECARVASKHKAWNNLKSVRKNLDLILTSPPGEAFEVHAEDLRRLLATPPVAICVGHMVDHPTRSSPRFPSRLEGAAKIAIKRWLKETEPCLAFSSMACGTDLLFQQAAYEKRIKRYVLTPFSVEDFREHSVTQPNDASWDQRFDRLWASAERACVAAQWPLEWKQMCFEFGNEYLTGLARMKADELGTDLTGIALWNGLPGDDRGGTHSVLRMWWERRMVAPITILDPKRLEDEKGAPFEEGGGHILDIQEKEASETKDAGIVGLLFADAKGFSKLNEKQADCFAQEFLGEAAAVYADYRTDAFEVNTWGDGLFFVFRNLERLGSFALDLRDRMAEARTRFETKLPEELGLRIALHAGPVRFLKDPLTGRDRVSGTQVSHAARIEPVTPAGQIYASEPFAALSRARGAEGFRCTYVGQPKLAKDYGRFPTYLVERA